MSGTRPKVKKLKRKLSIIHVVPDSFSNAWLVRAIRLWDAEGNRLDGFMALPGSGLVGAYYAAYQVSTKPEAIHLARTEAQLHLPATVIVHDRDGKIEDEKSFGMKPTRSEG